MRTADDAQNASGPETASSNIRSMNSVMSTLRVFEEVAMRQPIGVSELARVTHIPKSSVQRCLVTLQQAGWLRIADADQTRWGVTMKALTLGLRSAGEQDLRALADPALKRLAAETDETVLLGLRDGEDLVIVARAEGTQMVRVFMEIGTRVPLRASSGGVAIMCLLADEEIEELLAHELEQFEEAPVATPEELRGEMARTAERRYALNMSSWHRPSVASIGVAITNPAGQPVAALTLSIPESRYNLAREGDLARLVVATADEISRLVSSV